MRPGIALLLTVGLLIGGCHRQSQPAQQANAAEAAAPADTATGNEAAAPAGNAAVVEEVIGTLQRDHKGDAEPAVVFENPAGGRATLADFRGKPLLLNLWATWCGPCIKEMPTLDTLAGTLGDTVRVLAVSEDLEGAEKVDPFFQKAGFKRLQPYLDKENALIAAYGSINLPTTILYDSTGHEVWRMLGGMDWTGQTARELVAEAR